MFGYVLQILVNGYRRNMWKVIANITFTIKRHILLRNIWKTLYAKELEVGNRDRAENLGTSEVYTASRCQQDIDLVRGF